MIHMVYLDVQKGRLIGCLKNRTIHQTFSLKQEQNITLLN